MSHATAPTARAPAAPGAETHASATRHGPRLALLPLLLFLGVAGCGAEAPPPATSVADVAFGEPGGRDAWVDAFWEAAASLEVGEISDGVWSEYGYHVILLEDRRIIPFAEVRDRVLHRLVDLEARTELAQFARREVLALESVLRSVYSVRTAPATGDGASGG